MSDNILKSTRVEQNEIIKAEDVNSGYGFAIKNVLIAMRSMLDSNNNFVIGGLATKGTGYNITIEPVLGINIDDGFNPVVDTSKHIDAVSIEPSSDQQRIDTLMIKGENKSANLQQRAFVDFDSGTKTLQNFYTETELILNYKVKKGEPGVMTAPARDSGWIKIAEIVIPSTATSIDDCTINPVTADYSGAENTSWTNEKTATYNLKTISDLRTIFRKKHNADGSIMSGAIGKNELKLTGSGKVTGADIENGNSGTIGNTTYDATTLISNVLKTLAQVITPLYNDYEAKGKYNFTGEVAILNDADTDKTYPVKIKSIDTSTATISIGSDVILTLKKNKITVNSAYNPSENSNDLATMKQIKTVDTKANTNAANISNLQNRVAALEGSSANDIFSKFTFGCEVKLVTTKSVNLFATEEIIDGVSISDGDKVLVKNQSDAKDNGVYFARYGAAWERVSASEPDFTMLNKFFVATNGDTNKGKLFYTPATVIEEGTTELEFVESFFAREPISNKVVTYGSDGELIGKTVRATTEMIIPTVRPANPSEGSVWFE